MFVHDAATIAAATTGVIDTKVDITERMGSETYLYVNCEGHSLTARVAPTSTARVEDEIKLAVDPNRIHIFDKETEKAIIN